MVLFTITGGEVTPEIEMPSDATILDLKEAIEERLDVEVSRQTLWFNHIQLVNAHTIEYYGFQQVATIHLDVTPLSEQQKFNILVKSSIAEVNIRVKETKKVEDLIRKIERVWGIPSEKMTLLRLNKEMDNDFPLSAYYISEGSEVEVRVTVEPR